MERAKREQKKRLRFARRIFTSTVLPNFLIGVLEIAHALEKCYFGCDAFGFSAKVGEKYGDAVQGTPPRRHQQSSAHHERGPIFLSDRALNVFQALASLLAGCSHRNPPAGATGSP